MKRTHLFVCTWMVAFVFFTVTASMAQEKEKPKTGAAVDTWRQSLPPEAETEKVSDEHGHTLPLPANDQIQKTIVSLEQGWIEAIKVGDADSLGQLISSDFTFVSPRAVNVTNRNQYLEHALRELKSTPLELEKVTVQMFGRTAIVAGLLRQSATASSSAVGGSYVFTDVWINRRGTWQVVRRHESMLQK